jgi:hypothetical protein
VISLEQILKELDQLETLVADSDANNPERPLDDVWGRIHDLTLLVIKLANEIAPIVEWVEARSYETKYDLQI